MKRIQVIPDQAADRLLSGAVEPDDAPPGYSDVAVLLRAASSLGAARDQRGGQGLSVAHVREERFPEREERFPRTDPARERQQIAAMVSAISAAAGPGRRPDPKPARRRFVPRRLRLGALVAAGMLFGGTGLAFAGALPTPAQSLASTLLSKVGISVPNGQSRGSTMPGGQPTTPTANPAPTPSRGPDPNGPARHGLCTAFSSGQGGTSGGKNASVAFQNLQQAAQAAGQSVEEFCKTTTAKVDSKGNHPGAGHGHSASSHGRGEHQPRGSQPGGTNGRGKHQTPGSPSSAGHGQPDAHSQSHSSRAGN